MNEQIKALMKQATRELNPDDRVWVFSKVDQAKFAELIVRECAEVSKKYAGGSMPLSIALAIKKHFGVEE
jgi:hypothetical protein